MYQAEDNEGRRITTVSELVPLVHRLATRYRKNRWNAADREDIRQEGFVGLLEARGRYRPERGCSFGTFGGLRASGAMKDYVRRLWRKSREKVVSAMPDESLGYRLGHGEFEDPRSVESGVVLLQFREFLGQGCSRLDFLTPDELAVVNLRFFQGKSCREAAQVMGVSAATVCRLEQKAVSSVRKHFFAACGIDADSLKDEGRGSRGENTGSEQDSTTDRLSGSSGDEYSSEFSRIIVSLTL